MTVTTHGLRLKTGSHALRVAVELLSSMRFAISLLTVICIASIIGTVLQQHQPAANYVNQFGPFWAHIFGVISLTSVYSAWWFLLILGFLVLSTSLCVGRSTPRILADFRVYKEDIRERSLLAFRHRAQSALADAPALAAQRIGQTLAASGWRVKLQERQAPAAAGWMVAAKAGAANKLGYIAAHSAIVLVCIGGLLDGDLVVRAQMWLNGKTAYSGAGMVADVAPQHRLSEANPTFRANLLVTEGSRSSSAILSQSDGVLVQDLPFSIELKKFIVEHYSTGMPKLFASEIVIHDKATQAQTEARVEVNHPVSYRGVEIYQSGFDDGGSRVTLQAVPLQAGGKPFEVQGTIGGSSELDAAALGEKVTLEYTALRVINVENLSGAGTQGTGVDVRKVDLRSSIEQRLGAANKTNVKKDLRNVGPSIGYKLRDASGQAREYQNYMLPVDTGDGVPVYLMGVRNMPADAFRYLSIPMDDQGGMDGFLRLRHALQDAAQRASAVRRYVAASVDPQKTEMVQQLNTSAATVLTLFAEGGRAADGSTTGGLQAIADFMQANVPEVERERAGTGFVRILNGVLFELAQITREQARLPRLEPTDKTQAFMTQAVLSLSDAEVYPAPFALQLKDFTQVQASVFQVARAPGKYIVYLGCALLILGIFAMLYVRERRLWVWIAPQGSGSHATLAMSINRQTMDGDRDFSLLQARLLAPPPGRTTTP